MLPVPVARAVSVFAEYIEYPIIIPEAARTVGVSTRQLERSFNKATGQSPLHYYRGLRLNKARQQVMYSNDTTINIALSVGYTTSYRMQTTIEKYLGYPQKKIVGDT